MRLLRIDESNIGDHTRLTDDDVCLHAYEYTSGQNYAFSQTNSLINNLKKKPTSPEGQLYYKGKAIRGCAGDLRDGLNGAWLDIATIVPVPAVQGPDRSRL